MIQRLAKTIMFLIIPVLLWVIFNYLGGVIDLSDLIKRVLALVVAAIVMYKVSLTTT